MFNGGERQPTTISQLSNDVIVIYSNAHPELQHYFPSQNPDVAGCEQRSLKWRILDLHLVKVIEKDENDEDDKEDR